MSNNLIQRIKQNSRCGSKSKAEGFFDGSSSAVQISQFFATQQDAEQALQYFIQKAKQVESEPCEIHSEIQQIDNTIVLNMQITFCCEVEAVLFQMKI
ncbi:YfcZ/YiiS family protein [Lonepinella sp. MS14437]|uniref:YfcZ/YiiS family protein n=1 Tax=Lonepinella sp. MS14437 TaxID=3003620 RepID=UPI0036DAD975